MFKKSPKNCFKPVLPLIIQNGTKGQECENHAETQKSNNGPNMSYYNYFLLPQIDVVIGPNADYVPLELKVTQRNENNVYVSSSIYAHLCDIKQQIEKYQDTWDNIKKFTNPYEYIHSNITGNKTNISKLRPLSRSFYKMIEIMKNNNIMSQYHNTISQKPDCKMGLKTFHLAEGPGGFIEAVAYLRGLDYQRHICANDGLSNTSNEATCDGVSPVSPIHILKRNTEFHDEYMKEQEYLKVSRRIFDTQKETVRTTTNPIYGNDRYYGMTLVNDDPICPGWKKTRAFLENHPNVIIENGADKTGNLISLENFLYCAEKYKNKMDIVTADGGFDFSVDFNQQESMATQLILCEVFYALSMQKQGGSFILKIFDVFHKSTVDILYMLCYYYNHVSIMKPYTSRIANSEKYVVCQGFKISDSKQIIEQFATIFPSILKSMETKTDTVMKTDMETDTDKDTCTDIDDGQDVLASLLPFEHDLYFLNRIEEMNAMVSFQQIENITSTLSIITNHRNAEKLEQYKRANVSKCISWCEKYEIPHNANHSCFQSTNIFLHKSIQQQQQQQQQTNMNSNPS
jgi:23S rRNA U2552 (ribose-2'-O)-methylase RlmE/FtsJ